MHRPVMNRRQMLATSVTSGWAYSWSRRLPAAADLEPLSFVIVSDTHLGRKDNSSAERNWRKAIAEINRQPGEFVLHLGDVVDGGRPEQYPVYAKTRELLEKPIFEIPGNHDPVELFSQHVVAESDRSVDRGGIRFVLFNNARRDSHDGFISDDQNAWFAQQCDEAAANDLKIVVCCHVPIHSNRHPDRGWYVKPDNGQTEFYETRARHSDRILVCLHGHFHNGIRGWRDHGQTVEVLCPSVCYNQNRGLTERIAAGETTGFFVDELRPGYVLAQLGQGRLVMRYKPLDHDRNGQYAAEWK